MLTEGLQMENLWNLLSLTFEISKIAPACLVNWDPESSSLLKWMEFLNRQVLAEVQLCALHCIKLSLQRNNSFLQIGKCFAHVQNLGIWIVLSINKCRFSFEHCQLISSASMWCWRGLGAIWFALVVNWWYRETQQFELHYFKKHSDWK